MTTSERIRAAALGPAPGNRLNSRYLMDWLGAGSKAHVMARIWLHKEPSGFWDADIATKRLFLLFVAEAVK